MFLKRHTANSRNRDAKKEASSASPISQSKFTFIDQVKSRLNNSADLMVKEFSQKITVVYFDTMIEKSMLHQDILASLTDDFISLEQIEKSIRVGSVKKTVNFEEAILSSLNGSVLMHLDGFPGVVAANIKTNTSRSLSKPENESQVIGAQLAFNESLSTNISLIRRYITSPDLTNEIFYVGKQSSSAVSILYIKGIASEEMVATLKQRVISLKIDSILDSSILAQLIEDNSLSIFPQMVLTERPDRTSAWLLNGKIAVLVDGSVQAIGCPQSFIEFFQSMEDQNVRWHISTFLRILRMIAMMLSIFFTAVYVASLTFHYEIIPQAFLVPLSESRSRVPFPPIIEALLLEFIIELLREAGARLPTKVGQTMGIVGGIVIGTAAVQAGFTSNILIIIVALGALASFTTPSYMMGNVIRILRFPLIIFAGFWGFYGLMAGFCFLLIHLLRQSSLGSPFLAPFYPLRLTDWRDSIIRLPLSFTFRRPFQTRPKDHIKYSPSKGNEHE